MRQAVQADAGKLGCSANRLERLISDRWMCRRALGLHDDTVSRQQADWSGSGPHPEFVDVDEEICRLLVHPERVCSLQLVASIAAG